MKKWLLMFMLLVSLVMMSSCTGMSDEEKLETPLADQIPDRGHAIILAAPDSVWGFQGLHTLFVNENSDVLFEFDYTEHNAKYEDIPFSFYNISDREKATRYLEECNYFAGMQNYAFF